MNDNCLFIRNLMMGIPLVNISRYELIQKDKIKIPRL